MIIEPGRSPRWACGAHSHSGWVRSIMVRRQCQLLKLARSTAYYHPTPVSEAMLALMRRLDELHL